MDFGKRIRDLRKANGMTLDMLSAKSGMSKGYLSGIENGKVNPPVDRLVRKLARIFGQDEIGFLKLAYIDKLPVELQSFFRERLAP